jgi:CubicO group peptidase (beta-lactamase class C family)
MLPSGVLRVAVRGETVIEQCAGHTGGAGSGPCTPATRFQIASISKQFTAAAVLVLAGQGRLDLDDRITRWFPGGPDGWPEITVHQLLAHTSGLGHWEDFPQIDLCTALPGDRLAEIFRGRELVHAPGGEFYYSSPGYSLLAQIVQEVAGCAYAEFLGRALLDPIGLAATFAGDAAGRPDVALGHTDGQPVTSFELAHTGMGAGDVYSTAGDLDRWDRRLPGLLGEPWSRLAFTPHAPASFQELGSGTAYGYGWFVGRYGPLHVRYHTGHNAGFNSISAWLPERELSLTILANDDAADPLALARTLLAEHPDWLAG